METNIKSILERRIKGAEYQIAESESKIASEELYRNKWQIRKDAFENILEEWNEANKQNTDIALAKEAMNTHVHVNVELDADEMSKLSKAQEIIAANPNPFNSKRLFDSAISEVKDIESGKITPIKTDIFKEELKNKIKEPCKVFTEIEPFKEVPGFELAKSRIPQQIGKTKAYVVDDKLVILREQYHLCIYTTIEEIKRIKSLPEMTVKLTLQDYKKRTYPNKAVVLRHFLRDLKDVSELYMDLKPEPSPEKPAFKPIPTFITMKEIDELKKLR